MQENTIKDTWIEKFQFVCYSLFTSYCHKSTEITYPQ